MTKTEKIEKILKNNSSVMGNGHDMSLYIHENSYGKLIKEIAELDEWVSVEGIDPKYFKKESLCYNGSDYLIGYLIHNGDDFECNSEHESLQYVCAVKFLTPPKQK